MVSGYGENGGKKRNTYPKGIQGDYEQNLYELKISGKIWKIGL
jgi:hypothetical protein